ncbi:unnamed protein product [Sphenostylis stenocarpa]|uniref:Uncharacterized protein n=1 Tax=Sphenostylis stenocarpa TaxID=92480 RepID=A0AA86VJN9_9FABA|nr:unnamed protein product [Sphenostylis stenocarpa]
MLADFKDKTEFRARKPTNMNAQRRGVMQKIGGFDLKSAINLAEKRMKQEGA